MRGSGFSFQCFLCLARGGFKGSGFGFRVSGLVFSCCLRRLFAMTSYTLRVSGLLDVVLLGAQLREAREYRHRVDVHLFGFRI